MTIVYLSLADENDYRLKEIFNHMKAKIGEETNLASLGKILFEMGEYDQVEKCYRHMLCDAQLDRSAAYSGLSKGALGKKNLVDAAKYEQEALSIKESILPEGHRDLAVSYSRLGHIYCQQNDHRKALKYLEKAMKIEEDLMPQEPLILAKTYNRMASTYADLDEDQAALEYYEKAANKKDNEFTTPLFLFKAANIAMDLKNYSKAEQLFTDIKEKYPNSQYGKDIDKFINSAKYAQ